MDISYKYLFISIINHRKKEKNAFIMMLKSKFSTSNILKNNFPWELIEPFYLICWGFSISHRKNCTFPPIYLCHLFCDKLASITILIFRTKTFNHINYSLSVVTAATERIFLFRAAYKLGGERKDVRQKLNTKGPREYSSLPHTHLRALCVTKGYSFLCVRLIK